MHFACGFLHVASQPVHSLKYALSPHFGGVVGVVVGQSHFWHPFSPFTTLQPSPHETSGQGTVVVFGATVVVVSGLGHTDFGVTPEQLPSGVWKHLPVHPYIVWEESPGHSCEAHL
jgi:hypothetical protein